MAIGVMPPSLRLFESIALAAPLIRAGCAVRSAVVHDQASTLGCLDFTTLPAPFPFILSIPQGELMRILRERLADYSSVRYMDGCEATGVRQNLPPQLCGCAMFVTGPARNGRRPTWWPATATAVRCATPSVCRPRGKQYPVSFVMGDFPDTTTWQDEAHLFFTPSGSVESFPLPGEQRRWVALADSRKRDDGRTHSAGSCHHRLRVGPPPQNCGTVRSRPSVAWHGHSFRVAWSCAAMRPTS